MIDTWGGLAKYPGQRKTYALMWDSSTYEELGSQALNLAKELYALAGVKRLQQLARIGQLLCKDPFRKSAKQAEATGKTLARLIESGLFGHANISFIGFSLGVTVIYSCLRELAALGSLKVFDVILLGGAAPINRREWGKCKGIVSGRMVNVYSTTDRVLSMLYSVSKLEWAVGTHQMNVEGVEDYDLTNLVPGHMSYREKLHEVLQRINYNN